MGAEGIARRRGGNCFCAAEAARDSWTFLDSQPSGNCYEFARMQWYYSKGGTQLGPVEEGELRAKLASGEIFQTDLVWRDGMPDWLPAAKVPELTLSAFPTAPTGIPQISASNAGTSPYAAPTSQPSPVSYGPNIPNYLWQSIVVTIFCCWPFGIPAIVYAAKVDGLKARGDIAGAMAASSSAKTWCMVAAGIWVALIVLWLLFAGLTATFAS